MKSKFTETKCPYYSASLHLNMISFNFSLTPKTLNPPEIRTAEISSACDTGVVVNTMLEAVQGEDGGGVGSRVGCVDGYNTGQAHHRCVTAEVFSYLIC